MQRGNGEKSKPKGLTESWDVRTKRENERLITAGKAETVSSSRIHNMNTVDKVFRLDYTRRATNFSSAKMRETLSRGWLCF